MNDIKIISFGFLHGNQPKADITIDLRDLLSDPAHRPEGDMLDMTGLDKSVEEFVFATQGAYVILHAVCNLVSISALLKPTVLAIGCSGGRHRSVAFAERINWMLHHAGYDVVLMHLHVHLPRVIKNS